MSVSRRSRRSASTPRGRAKRNTGSMLAACTKLTITGEGIFAYQLARVCSVDPGFDVDLYVRSDLQTMTKIWMGLTTVAAEERAETLILTGDSGLKRTAQQWLGLSIFAGHPKNKGASIAMRL